VQLTEFDPAGEDKVLTAIAYPHTGVGEAEVAARAARLGVEERARLLAAYVGDRRNRRHRPGRALERAVYTFDVVADYGAFRDLQRHRMGTIGWQPAPPCRRLRPARGRRRGGAGRALPGGHGRLGRPL